MDDPNAAPEPEDLVARRVGRLAPDTQISAKHLRFGGGYLLFAFTVLAGINAYSWQDGELWPKALIISPALLLLGVWLLVDAKALASGRRRHQQAILWACVLVGSALGVAVFHQLTGRFF